MTPYDDDDAEIAANLDAVLDDDIDEHIDWIRLDGITDSPDSS